MVDPSNPKFVKRYDLTATTTGTEKPAIIGIVSTQPGVLLGGFSDDAATVLKVPVALTGRVPVKVSLAGGPIAIGDRIAPSSVPGIGVKATTTGYIVGIALESLDSIPAGATYGEVTVFVERSYYAFENGQPLAASIEPIVTSTTTSNGNTTSSTTESSNSSSQTTDGPTAYYDAQISSLQSQMDAISAMVASSTSSTTSALADSLMSTSTLLQIASSTADMLASSTPTFIARVANAVYEYLQSAGEWALDKLTAKIVYTDRIETQVAAVSKGLEMTDQATGQIYCVVIRNGEWDKEEGACSTATSTPEVVEEEPEVIVIEETPEENLVDDGDTASTTPDTATSTPESSNDGTDTTTPPEETTDGSSDTTTDETTPDPVNTEESTTDPTPTDTGADTSSDGSTSGDGATSDTSSTDSSSSSDSSDSGDTSSSSASDSGGGDSSSGDSSSTSGSSDAGSGDSSSSQP
jgi:hypothetical protein